MNPYVDLYKINLTSLAKCKLKCLRMKPLAILDTLRKKPLTARHSEMNPKERSDDLAQQRFGRRNNDPIQRRRHTRTISSSAYSLNANFSMRLNQNDPTVTHQSDARYSKLEPKDTKTNNTLRKILCKDDWRQCKTTNQQY